MHWEQQYALIFGGIFLASLCFYLFSSSRASRVPEIANEIAILDDTPPKRAKTPYDIYPDPVRFFGANDKLPQLPSFDLTQAQQRNCFVKLVWTKQGWRINSFKQEEKTKPTALKLPRKRATDAKSTKTVPVQQVTTPSSEPNVSEAQALTLLEQCNEESFDVELSNIETLPPVNNDVSPELQELMLLAACEEEECFA